MDAFSLFQALDGLIAPAIARMFPAYPNCCILATRITMEVGAYFGVEVQPLPVQVILYNGAYRRHVEAGEEYDIERWHREDGSHSVGVGFGAPGSEYNCWPGHLIATADGVFADYTIRQAERPQHGIITGNTLVGPYRPPRWTAVNNADTTVEYRVTGNDAYTGARDWTDPVRRRKITGPLIREMKITLTACGLK
jgi:hypothetical protein